MSKIILKIKDIYGPEIRTRRTMEDFAKTLSPNNSYLLDFEGIDQISRSATDELCNIINDHSSVQTVNMSPFVQKMFDTVLISRFSPRERSHSTSEIIRCNTIEDLLNYFASIKDQAK